MTIVKFNNKYFIYVIEGTFKKTQPVSLESSTNYLGFGPAMGKKILMKSLEKYVMIFHGNRFIPYLDVHSNFPRVHFEW